MWRDQLGALSDVSSLERELKSRRIMQQQPPCSHRQKTNKRSNFNPYLYWDRIAVYLNSCRLFQRTVTFPQHYSIKQEARVTLRLKQMKALLLIKKLNKTRLLHTIIAAVFKNRSASLFSGVDMCRALLLNDLRVLKAVSCYVSCT